MFHHLIACYLQTGNDFFYQTESLSCFCAVVLASSFMIGHGCSPPTSSIHLRRQVCDFSSWMICRLFHNSFGTAPQLEMNRLAGVWSPAIDFSACFLLTLKPVANPQRGNNKLWKKPRLMLKWDAIDAHRISECSFRKGDKGHCCNLLFTANPFIINWTRCCEMVHISLWLRCSEPVAPLSGHLSSRYVTCIQRVGSNLVCSSHFMNVLEHDGRFVSFRWWIGRNGSRREFNDSDSAKQFWFFNR